MVVAGKRLTLWQTQLSRRKALNAVPPQAM